MTKLGNADSIQTLWQQIKLYRCYLLLVFLSACAATSQTVESSPPGSASSDQKLIDMDPDQAAQIGQEALEKIGYAEILNLARQAGFLKKYEYTDASKLDYSAVGLTLEVSTFAWVFSRYAVSAGVTSQLDSPAPGPADVVALGILVVGLVDAGFLDGALIALMTARGRVGDTGVEEAMQTLINSAGAAALSRCDALDILLDQAHKVGDSALKRKIVATQKFYNCRASRSF